MTVHLESSIKRWLGESTDEKPYVGQAVYDFDTGTTLTVGPNDIPVGSTFLERDTGDIYRWNGADWRTADADAEAALEASGIAVETLAALRELRDFSELSAAVEQPVRAEAIEALLRQLQEPIRHACSVKLTCAAAGNYAAGDVLSANATDTGGRATYLPKMARRKGGTATIRAVMAKCSEDSVLNSVRMHVFREEPLVGEVEMDDNAAFDVVTAAGRDKHLGSVLLGAFVDRGTAEAESRTTALEEPFRCVSDDDGLWAVFVTEGAETNETAGQTIDLDFYTL